MEQMTEPTQPDTTITMDSISKKTWRIHNRWRLNATVKSLKCKIKTNPGHTGAFKSPHVRSNHSYHRCRRSQRPRNSGINQLTAKINHYKTKQALKARSAPPINSQETPG